MSIFKKYIISDIIPGVGYEHEASVEWQMYNNYHISLDFMVNTIPTTGPSLHNIFQIIQSNKFDNALSCCGVGTRWAYLSVKRSEHVVQMSMVSSTDGNWYTTRSISLNTWHKMEYIQGWNGNYVSNDALKAIALLH